jgi:bifunctional DNase/RNase
VRELSVIGVRVELPTNQPIVLLREVDGDRYLPIWIGAVEATAIAYEQQGVKPARPLTHDLLRDLLEALKAPLQAVEIVELRDSIFYADLLWATRDGARVGAAQRRNRLGAAGGSARCAAPRRSWTRPAS